MASGRPAFGSRFNTGNIESALLARGFHYGSAPNSVVIGWNGGHAAVTLPDGTPVSSGEGNHGVRIGGGGAYQSQFSHHMYLPVEAQQMKTEPVANTEAGPVELPATADLPAQAQVPAPEAQAPAPEAAPPVPEAAPPAPEQPAVIDIAGNGPLPGPEQPPMST